MVGSVSPLYAPATVLGRAGVVFGHDMTSEGLCFLFMNYYYVTNSTDGTQRLSQSFLIYLRSRTYRTKM